MKPPRFKKKWRLEYWESGRKHVRLFGSRGQAERFVAGLSKWACNVDIRQVLEKEE